MAKYYYSTVNKVVTTHSGIEFKDGYDKVFVRFEKPTKKGFKYAEGCIPDCILTTVVGFTENEVLELTEYLRNNAVLIWQFAQSGGGENA